MSGGYTGSTGRDDPVVRNLARQAGVIRELAKPTAAQIYKTLEEVRGLITGLQAQVDNLVNTITYDRATIDAKDLAFRNAAIAVANTAAGLANAAQADANVAQSTATGAYNGYLNPAIYSRDVSGAGRRALWIDTGGDIGWASSSREFKRDITAADIDPQAVLSMGVKFYHRVEQLRLHAEDPDYLVQTEVGMIAEELHDAGLWPFVIYEGRREDAVPIGIHYELWGLAQQVAMQWLYEQVLQLQGGQS